MTLIPLETARAHLRTGPGDEDDLITLYLQAAEQAAADYLNRKIYADQAAMDEALAADTAGEDPMVINAAVQASILLTLGHLYANREAVVTGITVAPLPFGAHALLRPHRRFPGF